MKHSALGLALLLSWLLAAACGETARDGTGSAARVNGTGGAGASSGNGGGGSSAASPCDAANAYPIWGKPHVEELDCIDTENHVENVACTIQPAEDAPPEERNHSDGFSCLRRLSDGAEFWVFAVNRLGFDPALWERCPDEPVRMPNGCYAAGCAEAPRSTCSLEETKKYHCGAEGEYDENCCGRQPCVTSDDCAADEECRLVGTLSLRYCWDNPGNPCDCGGPLGGIDKWLCFPRGDGGSGGQSSP